MEPDLSRHTENRSNSRHIHGYEGVSVNDLSSTKCINAKKVSGVTQTMVSSNVWV